MYQADITQIIISIIIAAIIGCIAGILAGGGGKGILGNAVFGIAGSLFASWLFPIIGISIGGQYGAYIEAVIGTVVLIVLLHIVSMVLRGR